MLLSKISIVVVLVRLLLAASENENAPTIVLMKHLADSTKAIDSILMKLNSRWQIHTHPNFLRSVSMSHSAWEYMKIKYMTKILEAQSKDDVTFVIGFMGSSVTAGHDSPFNSSFPVQTGLMMDPAFAPLKIRVDSRNSAMGNNPCIPYDICPRTYAGPDADIVHWEQSFNCFGSDSDKRDVFEQFIRQTLTMPNQPVVVFTSSDTPNWNKKDCADKDPESKPSLSADDRKALEHLKNNRGMLIASEVNKQGPATRPWSAMGELFKAYQTRAGIQLWDHSSYSSYKCTGPYIAGWQNEGVASWHPSLLGHELRAAHYAYFWLLILRDAVAEMHKNASSGQSLEAIAAMVKKQADHIHKHLPGAPLYKSEFSDHMQCITSFEPKHDPAADLMKHIIPSGDSKPAWTHKIFEEMTDPGIIAKARSRGYRDFKHMLYGDSSSSPLSIKIKIARSATGFLCQPPGNWGKLPGGFKNFWEVDTRVYLTTNMPDGKDKNGKPFSFSPTAPNTQLLRYTNRKPKDTQTICVDFAPFRFPVGEHVLTVVATSSEKVMISTLLLP